MVWLEPQFALIHTVIDLIWRSSAVIRSSAEAASGHIRHCICMSSTVAPMNRSDSNSGLNRLLAGYNPRAQAMMRKILVK